MNKRLTTVLLMLPGSVMALDVEAISQGLVNSSPWGQNAEVLPSLLIGLGLIIVLALVAKLLYIVIDKWRTSSHAKVNAQHQTDHWILEMGGMLHVSAPKELKTGGSPGAWQKYRHQVKQALLEELHRSRQLAAQAGQQQDPG